MLSNSQRGLLKIEPSWCYDRADCSAREINPGQECLCSRAKKGRMGEEIKGCERANACMGTERGPRVREGREQEIKAHKMK